MRQRKYRGQDIATGEWYIGWLLGHEGRMYITPLLDDTVDWQVDPDSVGQCTGKKDVHHKEIYENDLMWDDNNLICPVVWNEKTAGFCIIANSRKFDLDEYGRLEIIGYMSPKARMQKCGY